MKFETKFEFGDMVRDRITGFEGVVTAFAHFITGCDQYGVTPKAKDNKLESVVYFDEGRLDLMQAAGKPLVSAPTSGQRGADVPAPVKG